MYLYYGSSLHGLAKRTASDVKQEQIIIIKMLLVKYFIGELYKLRGFLIV